MNNKLLSTCYLIPLISVYQGCEVSVGFISHQLTFVNVIFHCESWFHCSIASALQVTQEHWFASFRLWNQGQGSLSLYLCSDCCVTPCWLIHVCEQQGVVSGVCDSLLSHKECFQSLPTSTGTKYVLNFHSGISTATPGLHQQKRNSWLLALMQVTCEAKGQSPCVLFQIPGNVLACSLCDQWGES